MLLRARFRVAGFWVSAGGFGGGALFEALFVESGFNRGALCACRALPGVVTAAAAGALRRYCLATAFFSSSSRLVSAAAFAFARRSKSCFSFAASIRSRSRTRRSDTAFFVR